MTKGNSPNCRNEWYSRFPVPGAFKLDHLLAANFVLKIFNFSHLYTGRPILFTQEGLLWERGILPIPEMNETVGFQCLGHSNWPFTAFKAYFFTIKFQFVSPLYWEPKRVSSNSKGYRSDEHVQGISDHVGRPEGWRPEFELWKVRTLLKVTQKMSVRSNSLILKLTHSTHYAKITHREIRLTPLFQL